MMCGTSTYYQGGSIVVPNGPKIEGVKAKPCDMVAWTMNIPDDKRSGASIPESAHEFRGDEPTYSPEMIETVHLLRSRCEIERPSICTFDDLAKSEEKMVYVDQLLN